MNKHKISREFKQLQNQIFLRTAIILFTAVILTFGLYSFVLAGHFANGVVAFLTLFVGDYNVALNIYIRRLSEKIWTFLFWLLF